MDQRTAQKVRWGWALLLTVLVVSLSLKVAQLVYVLCVGPWDGTDILSGLISIGAVSFISWQVYLARGWAPLTYMFIQVAFGIKHLFALTFLLPDTSSKLGRAMPGSGVYHSFVLLIIITGGLEILGGLILIFSPSVQSYFAYARSDFGSELIE